MDAIDYKIIELLQVNARLSIAEIARQVNLSRPSVSERLAKILDSGAIENFTALVSPAALGKKIVYFMELSDLKIPSDHLVKILSDNPHVTEIHCVTGKTNYLVKACVPDVDAMNKCLIELTKHCHVVTSIVLHSPLPHRPVKPV